MHDNLQKDESKQSGLVGGLAWAAIGSGLTVIFFALLPYTTLKTLVDRMAADGQAEVFTTLLHSGLRWLFGFAGMLLAAGGLVMVLHPQTLAWMKAETRQVWPDLRRLARDCNPARLLAGERWVLAGVMILYAALAITFSLRIPLRYDEAYTYMEFARHSFWQAISDYHVVNNHLFHTLMAHFSTRLFGGGRLALRLPALVAGLLLVPGLYALGRRVYNKGIGLAAAGMFSLSPVLMLYATSARGYTWVMLFTVWVLLLALRLQEGCDRVAWLLLIACGALGVWTIPVMVYPLAVVYLWLFIQAIVQPPAGIRFLRRLAGLVSSGMVMVALAFVLYTPAFGEGWLAGFLMRNSKLALPPEVFYANLGGWIRAPFEEWLAGYFVPVVWLLLAGLALSLVLHTRLSRWRVPLHMVAAAALFVILAVQRPESLTRMWSWLAPLFFLMCMAGLSGGLTLLLQKREQLLKVLPVVMLVLGISTSGLALVDQYDNLIQPPGYDAPQVTAYLQSVLTPDDVVVVAPNTDAIYWHTFDQAGIPETAIRGVKQRPFRRALVIVYPGGRETLEGVLEQVGPDAVFLDLDTVVVMQRFPEAEVYAVEAVHDRVEEAFP